MRKNEEKIEKVKDNLVRRHLHLILTCNAGRDFDLKIIDDNQKNDIEVKTLTPSEMQIDIINRLNNLDIEQLMIINNLIAKMKELDKSKEDGDKANKSISNEAVKLIREITTLNLKQSTMLYDFVHVMIKENV